MINKYSVMTLPADLLNPTSTSFVVKCALFLTFYRFPLTLLFNVAQEATVGRLSEYELINIFALPFPHLILNAKPFHLCPRYTKSWTYQYTFTGGSDMSDGAVTLRALPDWTSQE